MTTPRPLDLATWPRSQHFEHYRRVVPCTYSLTVDLDATALVEALRGSPRKTYPAQIWALATVVNRHEEFRMVLTDGDVPAVWPVSHPMFTVLNPERETFASVWAPYVEDFATFHDAAVDLLATHRGATEMFPQGTPPPNTFDISSLPWTSFAGFNLNLSGAWDHLAPILTLGRYRESEGRTLLPLAIQIHHAAADGFHVGRLVQEVADLLDEPDWIM